MLCSIGRVWLVAAAIACAGGVTGFARQAQNTAGLQRALQPVVLASTVYQTAKGPRQLTVWRRDLEAAPAAAVLRYLQAHPDKNAFPNVVLYAVDSDLGTSSTGRVPWITYDYFSTASRPWPVWSADVTVDPATGSIQIVTLKSISFDATLSLYQMGGDASIAAYPFDLTPQTIEKWPQAPQPTSLFQTQMRDRFTCGLSSIRVSATPAGLFVVGLRDRPTCPPKYYEYEAASKSWREMTVTPLQ